MNLIVFTGLPGTGKSSLADVIGQRRGIPVFNKDWLNAAMLHSGLGQNEATRQLLGYASYDLLTTLAQRQLQLNQSVILDSVASFERIRQQWRELALEYNATWQVIECVCSDQELQRQRLNQRQRHIPGWPELTWADVERVCSYYEPWHEERLIIDAVQPLANNIKLILTYL